MPQGGLSCPPLGHSLSQPCRGGLYGRPQATKSSYAMYERDERVPRDEVKVRISNFFGVSVQELFFN